MTEGIEGRFVIPKIDEGALKEIQDVLGPQPYVGARWGMVDLYTGQVHYYRRKTYKKRGKR